MGFKSKPIILISIVIALIVAAASFWYWSQKRDEVPEESAAAEVKDGLGAEAFNKTNNPLSNELPETNPFNVDINPFK